MSALWYIDEAGTAHPLMVGPRGPVGPSAYEVWLAAGNTGTVEDYHESLRGEPGPGAIPTHQTILLTAETTLPADHPVLTVRATEASTVAVADAPDGTVITVHVAEGWQHITWAPGITVTGATDTSETWVVLVRAEGAWQALVSGESEAPPEYDSGVVDITHLTNDTDWLASWGKIEARRLGSIVQLSIQIFTRATWQFATQSNVFPIPAGFRPSVVQMGVMTGLDPRPSYETLPNGNFIAYKDSAVLGNGMLVGAVLTYLTNDEKPDL